MQHLRGTGKTTAAISHQDQHSFFVCVCVLFLFFFLLLQVFKKLNGCIQNEEILSSFNPYCEYRHNDFIILNLLIALEVSCFYN